MFDFRLYLIRVGRSDRMGLKSKKNPNKNAWKWCSIDVYFYNKLSILLLWFYFIKNSVDETPVEYLIFMSRCRYRNRSRRFREPPIVGGFGSSKFFANGRLYRWKNSEIMLKYSTQYSQIHIVCDSTVRYLSSSWTIPVFVTDSLTFNKDNCQDIPN